MVLKGNVASYATRKKVWDLLTGPKRVGLSRQGAQKYESIELNKYYRGDPGVRFYRADLKQAESTPGCA